MKKYDVIVIGSGAGLEIAAFAAERGLKVALVEDGPLGGTCLNCGCIPSKMLIHSAEIAEKIHSSERFGIKSKIESIDFSSIVRRVNDDIDAESTQIEKSIKAVDNLVLYKTSARFTRPKILKVDDEEITAELIFIGAGTRPSKFDLTNSNNIPFLDSTKALRLEKQPTHLVIVGGGYIAAELAHFFGALGTKITILVRGDRMLDNEDDEIADWFTAEFMKKYNVVLQTEAESVEFRDEKYLIKLKNSDEIIDADQLLVAVGRTPNTDTLNISAAGIILNEHGYIKVYDNLKTDIDGIYAFGDIVGIVPFRHTANKQAELLIRNIFLSEKISMDYTTIGHAIFSSPQVAGVGKTEQELKKSGIGYRVGRAELKDTAMGGALRENGLAKVLTDASGEQILGVHLVGPDASILIHEAIVAMKTTGKTSAITDTVHIHPALNEWLQRAFHAIG